MKRIGVAVSAALLVAVGGCAASQSKGPSTTAKPPARTYAASATAEGVNLAVSLSPASAAGRESRYDLAFEVAVTASAPVTFQRPGGSLVDIRIRSVGTSTYVFESLAIDAEAIASRPAGFSPETSETVTTGSPHSSTYDVALPPGRYELTARTFTPTVAIEPLEVVVP